MSEKTYRHVGSHRCPDSNDPRKRDPNCPACKSLPPPRKLPVLTKEERGDIHRYAMRCSELIQAGYTSEQRRIILDAEFPRG